MSDNQTVRVRTYRHGLGDCFLLTFPGSDHSPVHVLVDCGVLLGTPDASNAMRRVVSNIDTTTGGFIDVVIATHEHWDHISGFNQARNLFDTLKFGEIWMAWTEEPDDPLATKLRDERHKRRQAVASAFGVWQRQLRASAGGLTPSDQSRLDETTGILAFFGVNDAIGIADDDDHPPGTATTADAMDYLRARDDPRVYLRPGQLVDVARTADVRAFVLGPPRNEKWLKKERPSTRTPETYHLGGATLSLADSFFGAVAHHRNISDATAPDAPTNEMSFPFDPSYQRQEAAPGSPLDPQVWFDLIYRQGPAWRQIDSDWLRSASDLALKLDSDTNNTSLVLAFELGDGGPVLLFPGDAQVGNWLSWQDVSWRDAPDVSADELLARTVFYKVAHHGSHNATLAEFGLERMTSRSLMAMVPVDRATAAKQRWTMPFEPLWTRLTERCRGRLLRSDELPTAGHPLSQRTTHPEHVSAVAVPDSETGSDLYIDLEITFVGDHAD